MTLHGHIQNGKIVLDHQGPLPEGAAVHVEIVTPQSPDPASPAAGELPTIAERFKDFIGCMGDLPPDLSVNHDFYLYGAPKRQ